ncbi:MAG TPA: hypothetical protein VF718_03860 [Allosphingosinicella sp.]
MHNQDRNPRPQVTPTEERLHWIAPKLQQFRAGEAQAGVTSGPDGPETGVS